MNERVKNLILEALRSGEYQQGRGQCFYKGCYCVTGVILDVYRKDTGDGNWNTEAASLVHNNGTLSHTQVQPCVWKWLGIEDEIPDYGLALCYNGGCRYWNTNDRGYPFDQLANIIEEHGICLPTD